MSEYIPVDCAIHSQLELHILHRDTLLLHWQDMDNVEHIETVVPTDIAMVRGEGEFLHFTDAAANKRQLRLDRIVDFTKCYENN